MWLYSPCSYACLFATVDLNVAADTTSPTTYTVSGEMQKNIVEAAGSVASLRKDLSPPLEIIFMIFLDSIQKRVEYLREIQTQHDELEAKFLEERAALEAK
nr:nucleosome assembly protein 1;2-like [Ipomoea batatas]